MSATGPAVITSRRNERVIEWAALLARKGRAAAGRFLVEGRTENAEAIAAGLPPVEIVWCPDLAGEECPSPREEGAELVEVSQSVFEKLSLREHPDGVLGVYRTPDHSLAVLPVTPDAFYVVLDGIEKPGNLGALARTARAAGAAGIVVSGNGCEPENPNAIRASRGHLFALPVAVATPENIAHWAGRNGIRLMAAMPEAALAYWNADFSGPIGIVLGEEARGLSEFWTTRVDLAVGIPMAVAMDSLNVSVSGALLLYEAARRRAIGLGSRVDSGKADP